MDSSFAVQMLLNFLMLGAIYAIVAAGFSLYFGVVDVVHFAHGDILALGAYAGLAGSMAAASLGLGDGLIAGIAMVVVGFSVASIIGALIGRYLVLPLKGGSPINVLLITLMTGTAIRELLRIAIPGGQTQNPSPWFCPITFSVLVKWEFA
ncbi:ABC transporter permease subunit [Burkholderia sp. PAMC 26561]|uniref:ABC transporter permease subunit n=1 Tax=Burkholderia sp. PAMC 26561 TaxID=1795043 RepID=UPI000AF4AB08